MRRLFKIGLYLALSVACLVFALVIFFARSIHRTATTDDDLEQIVQLSNSAFLRVHGTPTEGPDSGYSWEISYRTKSGWEKADDWWDGVDGSVIACPLGKIVVVAQTNGERVFVRTEAGGWKTFHMDIPQQSPFPVLGMTGTTLSSLDTPEIQALRSRMSVRPEESYVRPQFGQLLPEKWELWVDYMTAQERRFRLSFKISTNGEKLRLIDVEELPFDRQRPYFDQFVPDALVDPTCDKVEFFRRVPDSPPRGGVALLLDPQHPSTIESVEGWRVRKPQSANPNDIYLLIHGERRLIPTMDVYKNLFGADTLSSVHSVGKNFDGVPEGDPFSADAGLWRFPDQPGKIYLFDTGEYHWIKNSETLKRYGFNHGSVRDGTPYLLSGHVGEPLGPP